ncbi:MAG: hypothetical protein HN742_15445 [Lentisphaerae bacterium]|jgi:hypothetical protein|nr:hypothetical protein [Lentisphaerota bacterium]MBT4815371.1 hypothetical protein [Lentisphaerota bacterium]MBT5604382.1 hypothetical protein [Lentisphaerota bacterium]MBT7055217.1 hypothetical protein [Lentisphaerota bacterium]MBT7843272.1 hypothetical protein [Lentisphaerota bacterium]
MTEPTDIQEVIQTYVPEQVVLTRLVGLAIGMVVLISGVLLATQATPEHALHHVQQRGPAHLLFVGFIIAYLLYLNKALFHTLGKGHRIEETPDGLTVILPDTAAHLAWGDIERIEFGEVYLKIKGRDGTYEIPFIPKARQREIYRKHFRQTGLNPNQHTMRPFFPGKH